MPKSLVMNGFMRIAFTLNGLDNLYRYIRIMSIFMIGKTVGLWYH